MNISNDQANAGANHCPIFQGTTLDERGQILERLDHVSFPKGETILKEGNLTQYLWIIIRGRCQVIKATPSGPRELAILDSGAIFGEMSFFNPAPHSASVNAESDVEIMRLSREDYDALESNAPSAAAKIAMNTIKVLAERLQKMDEFTARLVDSPESSQHKNEFWEFRSKLYNEWQY